MDVMIIYLNEEEILTMINKKCHYYKCVNVENQNFKFIFINFIKEISTIKIFDLNIWLNYYDFIDYIKFIKFSWLSWPNYTYCFWFTIII